MQMTLGTRIKEQRGRRKMSVAELARRVGLAPSTVYGLERDQQRSTTKIHLIARALSVEPLYLESGKGTPDVPAPIATVDPAALDLETLEAVCALVLSTADKQGLELAPKRLAEIIAQSYREALNEPLRILRGRVRELIASSPDSL